MPDFSRRSEALEIMDDLQCQGEVVDQTLRELEFINRWLGGNAVTLHAVKRLASGHGHERMIIADLGCGGGDLLKLIAQWARKRKLKVELMGIDANPHIIEFAKANCAGYPEITFLAIDVFSPEFAGLRIDIAIGTLFFHHLDDESFCKLFASLSSQCRLGVVLNDIHRHWLSYYSILWLTRLFSKSAMVRYDAPLSVLRAFQRKELVVLMRRAGITNFLLRWRWAFRWELVASRKVTS